MIDIEVVKKVADLAKISLENDAIEKTSKEFGKILNFFAQLEDINTEDTEPMVTALDSDAILRKDQVKPQCSVDEILKNAPEIKGQLFKVPPVV